MTCEEFALRVQSQLKIPCRVCAVEETRSTNDDLKALACLGEEAGTVLVAFRQTGGRGRLGRSFYSPDQTGLYLSVLLRPDDAPEDAVFLTPSAAVAATRAIKTVLHREVEVKWVNDLYYQGKKVCGILTEAALTSAADRLEYAVCGIGINLCPPKGGFPEELSAIAGALCDTFDPNLRADLAAAFLNELFAVLQSPRSEILEEYRSRCMLIGKKITSPTAAFEGIATVLGVDDRAGLVIQREDGLRQTLNGGEVSVRLEKTEDERD